MAARHAKRTPRRRLIGILLFMFALTGFLVWFLSPAFDIGEHHIAHSGGLHAMLVPPAHSFTPPGHVNPSPVPAPVQRLYRVASGDTLWNIALHQLGNGQKWHQLAAVNHLKNPGSLKIGQVLKL